MPIFVSTTGLDSIAPYRTKHVYQRGDEISGHSKAGADNLLLISTWYFILVPESPEIGTGKSVFLALAMREILMHAPQQMIYTRYQVVINRTTKHCCPYKNTIL